VDANKITPACFQGGTTPELQIGSGFSGADWNDPHVLKVGAEYWMYASSNMGFNPPPTPVQIYRFTSSDAVTALHHAYSSDGLTGWTQVRRRSAGSPTSPGPRAESARAMRCWTGRPCGSTSRETTLETPMRGVSGR
jgi:hypothetical protein